MELLIRKGVSIEATNTDNNTPLNLATQGDHAATAELLKNRSVVCRSLGGTPVLACVLRQLLPEASVVMKRCDGYLSYIRVI